MREIERRIALLEQTRPDKSPTCFWCQCEDEPAEACAHRDWKVTKHEDALTELD
jgi:hypothetical protein